VAPVTEPRSTSRVSLYHRAVDSPLILPALRCLFSIGLIPIMFAPAIHASDKQSEATIMVQSARALSDIRKSGNAPFRLEAHLRLAENGTTKTGEYVEIGVSPKHWRREITLPDYHFLEIKDPSDEKYSWVTESRGWTNPKELLTLVRLTDLDSEQFTVKKIFQKQLDGLNLSCFEAKEDHGSQTTCFQADKKLLRSVESSIYGTKLRREYLDYSSFNGSIFPRLLRSHSNDTSMELSVTKLVPEPNYDAGLLLPPSNAEHRPNCKKPT
jgi:hypothetical protein